MNIKEFILFFLPELFLLCSLLSYIIYMFTVARNKSILDIANAATVIIILTIILMSCQYLSNGTFIHNTFSKNDFMFIMKISSLILTLISLYFSVNGSIQFYEYYFLLILANFAFLIMLTAENLVLLFITIEILSLIFFILTTLKRKSVISTEAGLKYFLYGSFASSFLFFGIAILFGFYGTVNLKDLLHFLGAFDPTFLNAWVKYIISAYNILMSYMIDILFGLQLSKINALSNLCLLQQKFTIFYLSEIYDELKFYDQPFKSYYKFEFYAQPFEHIAILNYFNYELNTNTDINISNKDFINDLLKEYDYMENSGRQLFKQHLSKYRVHNILPSSFILDSLRDFIFYSPSVSIDITNFKIWAFLCSLGSVLLSHFGPYKYVPDPPSFKFLKHMVSDMHKFMTKDMQNVMNEDIKNLQNAFMTHPYEKAPTLFSISDSPIINELNHMYYDMKKLMNEYSEYLKKTFEPRVNEYITYLTKTFNPHVKVPTILSSSDSPVINELNLMYYDIKNFMKAYPTYLKKTFDPRENAYITHLIKVFSQREKVPTLVSIPDSPFINKLKYMYYDIKKFVNEDAKNLKHVYKHLPPELANEILSSKSITIAQALDLNYVNFIIELYHDNAAKGNLYKWLTDTYNSTKELSLFYYLFFFCVADITNVLSTRSHYISEIETNYPVYPRGDHLHMVELVSDLLMVEFDNCFLDTVSLLTLKVFFLKIKNLSIVKAMQFFLIYSPNKQLFNIFSVKLSNLYSVLNEYKLFLDHTTIKLMAKYTTEYVEIKNFIIQSNLLNVLSYIFKHSVLQNKNSEIFDKSIYAYALLQRGINLDQSVIKANIFNIGLLKSYQLIYLSEAERVPFQQDTLMQEFLHQARLKQTIVRLTIVQESFLQQAFINNMHSLNSHTVQSGIERRYIKLFEWKQVSKTLLTQGPFLEALYKQAKFRQDILERAPLLHAILEQLPVIQLILDQVPLTHDRLQDFLQRSPEIKFILDQTPFINILLQVPVQKIIVHIIAPLLQAILARDPLLVFMVDKLAPRPQIDSLLLAYKSILSDILQQTKLKQAVLQHIELLPFAQQDDLEQDEEEDSVLLKHVVIKGAIALKAMLQEDYFRGIRRSFKHALFDFASVNKTRSGYTYSGPSHLLKAHVQLDNIQRIYHSDINDSTNIRLDTVNRYVAFRTTILTEIGNMLMLRIFALKKDVTLAELFLPVWVIETYIYEISTFFAYTLFLVKNFSPILGYLFNPIALGFLLIIIGLLFKIGAAPFHMWLPDVYEGAPNVVMAYFAITPKIMILTLLIRLCSLSTVFIYCQQLLIISAFLSLSFGTIMSIYQYNLKRFLAYSTLTHLGYMLLALLSNTTIGIQFLIFYMFSYTIMNIALFSILLSLNNKIQLKRNDYLTNLIGLGYSNKILAISLTIVLLSFAGIPPFIGFYSKYYIFLITMAAGKPFLAMIALVASILASVYYVRIIKMLFFEKSYKLGYYTAMPTSSAMLLVLSLYIIILFWYDQSFFFLWLYQLGINRP